jgi:hypothetical protein
MISSTCESAKGNSRVYVLGADMSKGHSARIIYPPPRLCITLLVLCVWNVLGQVDSLRFCLWLAVPNFIRSFCPSKQSSIVEMHKNMLKVWCNRWNRIEEAWLFGFCPIWEERRWSGQIGDIAGKVSSCGYPRSTIKASPSRRHDGSN